MTISDATLDKKSEKSSVTKFSWDTWAVLARTHEAFGNLTRDPGWTAAKLEPNPRVGVWTDDFHNLLAIVNW